METDRGDTGRGDTGDVGYPSLWQGLFTLFVLVLAYVVSLIDRQVLSLLVTPIKKDLGVGDFQMSLLVGLAFAIFYSIFGLPLGRIADRTNRKHLIALGIVLWSVATIFCGFSNSFAALFVFRMMVGIGEAALAPAGYSLLSDTFPPHRLVRATSTFALGGTLGSGLALLVGGQVIDYFATTRDAPMGLSAFQPWQATFIVVGLPGFVVAALIMLTREPARRGTTKAGSAVSAHSFAYLWERRLDYLPIYVTGALMAVLAYGGLTWFPTHIIRTYGLTPGQAGFILGIIQIAGSVLGALLSVFVTERFLARGHPDAHLRTVMITSACAALTFIAPLMPTLELTLGLWFVSLIFQSSYYGTLLAALQIITPNRARGTNSSVYLLVTTLIGLAGGSALIGAAAQFVFPDGPRALGYGMALVGSAAGLIASFWAWRGMPRYRRAAALHL